MLELPFARRFESEGKNGGLGCILPGTAMSGSASDLRKRAEESLRRQEAGEPEGSAGVDDRTRQLIHELQVHKIELEAQNEELRLAQLDLEAMRTRYLDLFNLAPVGYLTLTEKGIVQEANVAATDLLRVEKSRLPGNPLSKFIAPACQDAYYAHRFRIFNGEGRDACELTFKCGDGSECVAKLESIFARNGQKGTGCWWIVITDVTERNRADEQLRKLSTAVEHSPSMVLITNPEGTIEYANSKLLEVSGYTIEEVIGGTPSLLACERTARRRYKELNTAASKGREWRGELRNTKKDGTPYWVYASVSPVRAPDGAITHYVLVQEDITVIKDYETQLLRQASHDRISDLPNRFLAMDHLQSAASSARRYRHKVGVLFIDLDNFKKINDTMGHAAGDQFLLLAAQRLCSCVREEDTVARLGGDEFTVILPKIKNTADAEPVIHKILKAFSSPFVLEGREAFVTASIGVALFPDDGENPDVLMQNADIAMYRAKQCGRNTFRFFSADLNALALERMGIEGQLSHALERQELEAHYQPIIETRSGRIVGAEALLRWNNVELGDVTPAQFIHLAEETGLIVPIGRYMLNAACHERKNLLGRKFPEFRLSVNISSRQFRGQGLVRDIKEALTRNDIPPHCLELEITEGLLMEDLPDTRKILRELGQLGVRLSLDDFGIGYSSLGYLKRFPVNGLKIDKSFIHGLPMDRGDVSLVEAIIAMARSLHIDVTAEGVETEEQLRFLHQRGCDFVQGFYLSQPLSAEQFQDLMKVRGTDLRPAPTSHRL
jgi:diguanylate cyclase (GGDEF)-like protein/PAS domain S-box-containing protein